MSEHNEQTDQVDEDAVASLDPDEGAYDQDLALGEDGEEDVAQGGYSPNEQPLGVGLHGTTAQEQHDGSTVEDRVAAERPDVDGERAGEQVLPPEPTTTDALGEDVAAEDLVPTDETELDGGPGDGREDGVEDGLEGGLDGGPEVTPEEPRA